MPQGYQNHWDFSCSVQSEDRYNRLHDTPLVCAYRPRKLPADKSEPNMISPTEPVAQRSATRGITEFLITTVCMLSFASIALFFGVTEVTGSNSGTRDYIVYWATGQQFAHLANPYDATAIYALESNAGFPK